MKPKPLRFTLRTLLVVTAILALIVAVTVNRLRTRKAAMVAIRDFGGTMGYKTQGPEWMRNLIGDDDYFVDVVRLSLGPNNHGYDPQRPIGDDELRVALGHMTTFRAFSVLDLTETSISDNGLEFLRDFPLLEHLILSRTRVGDRGLGHLAGFQQLERLDLGDTDVTDSGLEIVKRLSSLTDLSLRNTSITDEGLRHVSEMQTLEELDLRHTGITDKGIQYVRHLVGLRELNLRRTKITDEALRYVATLRRLEELELEDTKVTDAGLQYVRQLINLRELQLKGTQVTKAAVRDLEQVLPNCTVESDY